MNDGFVGADEIPASLARFALFAVPFLLMKIRQSLDEELFLPRTGEFQRDRVRQKTARPLRVVDIGHGHSPVGHRRVGVHQARLAKRTLGFEIPEPMQLADALIEKALGTFVTGGDGEGDLRHPGHEIGPLARTLVEGVAMPRMTRSP